MSVHQWSDGLQLSLAVTKCTVLYLGPRTNIRHQYSINETDLPSQSCVRDLGVLMSSNLMFTEHCNSIAHCAAVKVSMIFNSFLNRSSDFILHMYIQSLRSQHLRVCFPSLEPQFKTKRRDHRVSPKEVYKAPPWPWKSQLCRTANRYGSRTPGITAT